MIYVDSNIQVCVYLWHSSLSLGVKWRLEELKGRCLEACCSSCCDRGVIPQFQRSEKFVQSTKFCIHPSGPLQSRKCEAAGDNHMLSKCSSKTQSLLHQIIQDHHMYLHNNRRQGSVLLFRRCYRQKMYDICLFDSVYRFMFKLC